MVLPQPEPIIVPGGKIADVQPDPGEPRDLSHLSLREEPIGDSALIEDFDRPCVQTACTRAGELLAGAPLDNGNVDGCQRQLASQHQSSRACHDDHHCMAGHRHTPLLPAATNSAAREPHVDNRTHISRASLRLWLRSAFLPDEPGLEASPLRATYLRWRDGWTAFRLFRRHSGELHSGNILWEKLTTRSFGHCALTS